MKVMKKRNIALWIAAVLFCLVLLSTSLNSGIYARFRSAARGNDRPRIAAFSVNAEMTNSTEDYSYNISFSNRSEVAVRYSVDIALTDPDTANRVSSVQLLQGNVCKNEIFSADSNTVIFENVGSLDAGESIGNLQISFSMNQEFDDDSANEPDFDNEMIRSAEGFVVPFTVTVGFSQIN